MCSVIRYAQQGSHCRLSLNSMDKDRYIHVKRQCLLINVWSHTHKNKSDRHAPKFGIVWKLFFCCLQIINLNIPLDSWLSLFSSCNFLKTIHVSIVESNQNLKTGLLGRGVQSPPPLANYCMASPCSKYEIKMQTLT